MASNLVAEGPTFGSRRWLNRLFAGAGKSPEVAGLSKDTFLKLPPGRQADLAQSQGFTDPSACLAYLENRAHGRTGL